jgi:hypothetical protein
VYGFHWNKLEAIENTSYNIILFSCWSRMLALFMLYFQ